MILSAKNPPRGVEMVVNMTIKEVIEPAFASLNPRFITRYVGIHVSEPMKIEEPANAAKQRDNTRKSFKMILKYELTFQIFETSSDLGDIFGFSLTSRKEGKAIKMIGTPSIQNDHLQLPNSVEM
jgi:hypothetical protein